MSLQSQMMREGWNTMPNGEEVFFIHTLSAGLWAVEEKIRGRRDFASFELCRSAI